MRKIEREKEEALYKQVKNAILEEIKNKKLKSGDKIPSMVELSKHFEVSIITVKQAISELVKEGYLVTKGSKGTYVKDEKEKRNKIIGLVFPAIIQNPFFSEICYGIEDVLRIDNYSIIICNTDYNIEKELRYLKEMEEKNVAGIIFCPCYSGKDSPSKFLIENFIKNNVPVVFIDIKIEGVDVDYVRSNNFEGGYEATKYLIEMGHKRIGLILSRNVNTIEERLMGYKKALKDYEIKYDEILVKKFHRSESYEEIGYVSTLELMHLKNPPTAIITSTDTIAIGVYKACHKLGLKIPDDISVIGYDNLSFSKYLSPSLTTVNQLKREMGIEAAKILIERLNGENSEPKNIILKSELVKRESCGNAKIETVKIENVLKTEVF